MSKEKKAFKDTLFGKIVGKAGNIAGDIPQIMGQLSTGNVLGAISTLTGNLTNSSDPKDKQLLNQLSLEMEQIKLELAQVELEEFRIETVNITERWKADSNSDSWLSKNIRPLVVANFTLLIDAVIISSMAGRNLGEAFLPILMTMGITAIGGYFTLREYGKKKN